MMDLTVETQNEYRKGDIINAYNEALKESNLKSFVEKLKENIGDVIIGNGGNHIFITEKTSLERIAIITNLFYA